MREKAVPGDKFVRHQLPVDEDKNLLPPLHIKFGSMKNIVKAMNKHDKGFAYLRENFHELIDAILKEIIYWTANY